MEKVYLVASGYHEDYSVKAVFTEENKAKAYAERLNFIPRSPGYDVDIESNTDYGVLYEANRGSHYITLEAKIDIYPDDTWKTINKRGYETLNNNFMKWKEECKNG